MKLFYTLGLVLCLQACGTQGQENKPPTLAEGLRSFTVREDTPVGAVVYNITAFDVENDPITYNMEGENFIIDRNTGHIQLTRRLDYENMRTFPITIFASDGFNNVQRTVTVNVLDVNDETPEFSRESYTARISESSPPGTTVLRSISVTDPDDVNSALTVVCLNRANANEEDPCDYFRIQEVSSTRNSWLGHLVLSKQVDFDTGPSEPYSVLLEASDGLNRRQVRVLVAVDDVQDSPPVFEGSLTAAVSENQRAGTSVMTFTASDGDRSGSTIEYELVSNPGDYFTLDRRTGRLTTSKVIDRETLFSEIITIQVAASEANDPNSRTVTQATITVTDVNDNGPRFEVINPATVTIKEDIANLTPLDTSITVSDPDGGGNSQFRLRLLTYNDTFEIFPSIGRGSLTANIRVKDTSKIDYESGLTLYRLLMEARETQTGDSRSANAGITVNVVDVNDNKPQFAADSYTAEVSETAAGGTVVTRITATDADSGIFGVAGVRYKLSGNGADKFRVNRITGEITVKQCPTPGSGNCLDAEQQAVYNLIFLARDNYAEGFVEEVPLTIRVLDENDNSPRFTVGDYESQIGEGEVNPNPPVVVRAIDEDSDRNGNNRITYSIVGGNPNGLWQIGSTSGVITATRGVSFGNTPGGSGIFTLTIQAADPRYRTTGTVRIRILDRNDFPPVFVPSSYYEEYIAEDSPPGTSVVTVQALDNDSPNSPNGQVNYRIDFGSQDKFIINPQSGVVTVNSGATFDFDVQRRYQMTVIVADGGTPAKSATGTVVVFIRDANNKKPYFEPSSVRVDIYENATVNTRVTQMVAKDPDSNAVLIYSFKDPINAWNPNGRPVNLANYNFKDLFTIDPNSGIVRTKTRLDRDQAAVVSMTVGVRDTTGGPDQTATATLIVNILEINDRPPEFPKPWTPTNRYLNISVREELPPSYYVTTIIATDPFDTVVEYKIIEDPGDYFNINPVTGVVTINRPIDYESVQNTYFVMTAADDGRPPLTSTATVNVNVININDNNPGFTQFEYNIELEENSPPGSTVVVLTASDLDLGDYGVVRYSLDDPQNRFVIDPITGVVTVREGAVLDRETTEVITISVVAYDSPNNPNDRKSTTIPIYITLVDDNDHTPKFTQKIYETSISETVPVQYSVITVTATDDDMGPNSDLTYFVISGNPQRLFFVNPKTGLITTNQPLVGRSGPHNITIGVRDGGNPSLRGEALVIINVIESNNEPPRWITPGSDNATIGVLENQYLGMIITQVIAEDDGEDGAGDITYGFYYNNQFVAETPNFRINPITGVITARAVFDRETKDEYIVKLVARDHGSPPFETTRFAIIKILDTDDHDPTFELFRNCCVIPVRFEVKEELPRGLTVGRLSATDLDIGQNAETRYNIIGGNVDKAFYINATTGILYTNKSLDHETIKKYTLTVRASNIRTKNRPNLIPDTCLCKDPSVIMVTVIVVDTNDFIPIFRHGLYNACVSIDAQIGKSVTTIRTIGHTPGVSVPVFYSLNSIESKTPDSDLVREPSDLFLIGITNGTVFSNMLMTFYENSYFKMNVQAANQVGQLEPSDTTLRVFVTDPAHEVVITVKERPDDITEDKLQEIIRWVSNVTNGGIVCINDIRYHITADGDIAIDWTDILLHVIDGKTLVMWEIDKLIPLLWPGGVVGPVTGALGITGVAAASSLWGGFIIDPVLIAVILIILLLLLLLLLLCCLYCCMKMMAGRERKAGLLIGPGYGRPTGTINPLWKEKLYEEQELNMKLDTVDRANAGFVMDGDATARLALGDGQVTQTRTETRESYQQHYEQRSSQQQILSSGETFALNGGAAPMIEAPLEGSGYHARNAAVLLNGGGSNLDHSFTADNATQVELMASMTSLREEPQYGPSAIGARLHSYSLEGTQEVHSNDFYNGGGVGGGGVTGGSYSGRHEEYVHSYPGQGPVDGVAIHDIHVEDSERSLSQQVHIDSPDGGLYQGEIILGSHHAPQFPNQQRTEARYHSQQYLYDDNYQ